MELLIQEPITCLPNRPGFLNWYDPDDGGIVPMDLGGDFNLYVPWSDELSREKGRSGAVWDCMPLLSLLQENLHPAGRVVRIAVCQGDEWSGVPFRNLKYVVGRKGELFRELGVNDQVLHTLSLSHEPGLAVDGVLQRERLYPLWQYAVIVDDSSTLTSLIRELPGHFIALPKSPAVINLINAGLMKRLLELGIVVLFWSDERYSKFPAIFSRKKIGPQMREAAAAWSGPIVPRDDLPDWF